MIRVQRETAFRRAGAEHRGERVMSPGLRAASCLAGVLAVAAAGCGSDDGASESAAGEGGGKTLTIYSDMPLQGAGGPQSRSVVNGQKLALEQSKGMAGTFKINFVSLDNSTAQAGSWTPDATSSNARKV